MFGEPVNVEEIFSSASSTVADSASNPGEDLNEVILISDDDEQPNQPSVLDQSGVVNGVLPRPVFDENNEERREICDIICQRAESLEIGYPDSSVSNQI